MPKKEISINLAESNQQNQTRYVGIFSTYFVSTCTIKNNFVLCAISKKTVA